jgi:hypothetical protein
MPRARRSIRWEHPRAPEGFVAPDERGGDAAFVYILADGKRWRKSLRPLRFIPAHRSAAITALQNLTRAHAWRYAPARVRVYSDGTIVLPDQVSGVIATEPEGLTVQDLYDLFHGHRSSLVAQGKLAAGSLVQYRAAYKAFFDGEQDIYLSDSKGILSHVLQKVVRLDMADRTKTNYLATIRSIFEYGARLDVIDKNPLPAVRDIALRAPGGKSRAGRGRRMYTDEEYARLLAEARRTDPALVLMIELYYLTGLRLAEGASLRTAAAWLEEGYSESDLETLPHVMPGDYLQVQGKGHRGQPRWRTFPLELLPASDTSARAEWKRRTWHVVDELVTVYAPLNRGYLSQWSYAGLKHKILAARDAAKLPAGLDIHSLRYNALNFMDNELNMSDKWMDRAVGNSKAVRKEVYVAKANADQLRRME